MRIRREAAPEAPAAVAAATAGAPQTEEPSFRLSPPEPPPHVHREVPFRSFEPTARPPHVDLPARFELIDDDDRVIPASPAAERGLKELAEFQRDPREYRLADEGIIRFFSLFRRGGSRPAGWLTVKWRKLVTLVLNLLRWVDAWAYLISIPFLLLMPLGLALPEGGRGLVHFGAVVVVLANYGRFWADLLAFFVRPFKDSPIHGLAFLFPPYTLYYVASRWKSMKPILRRMVTSCIPIGLVVLAYAFLPSVNPALKDVRGVVPKLKAGTQELVKEIESVPSRLKEELPSLDEAKKIKPERTPKDEQRVPRSNE
jgi:hypothetical protein